MIRRWRRGFPVEMQRDSMQCGVACLRMLCRWFGRDFPLDYLDSLCQAQARGVSLLGIQSAARTLGLDTMCVRTSLERVRMMDLPAIMHWKQNHFVVLYRISGNGKRFHIADPGKGRYTLGEEEFAACWLSTEREGERKGVAMMAEPTESFPVTPVPDEFKEEKRGNLRFIGKYLVGHRRRLVYVMLAMLFGCVAQMVFPFLTQALVDVGINGRRIGFVWLILFGELVIVLGRTAADFLRRWLVLHMSMHIDISLVSDFIRKLFRLPMRFFDSRHLGDYLRRMDDHRRVREFLSSQALGVVFVSLTLIVLGIVLLCYNLVLFLIFLGFSAAYAGWICIFLHRRKVIDYELFEIQGRIDNKTYQLLSAMQEIKLQNCERLRRIEWEDAQRELFGIRMKSLKLQQTQEAGAVMINELKNILITVLAAASVINGSLTIGGMMAILFIIGQLNSPVEQLMGFIYSLQDVRISLDRINEVRHRRDEEDFSDGVREDFMAPPEIRLSGLDFKYDVHSPVMTLKDIDITVSPGKTTAIVGASGSGKTTLLKLILGYYPPLEGEIRIGGRKLSEYSPEWWRSKCGVVMQDGVVFSDSIARNIAMTDDESIDRERLARAARMACMEEYIEGLPLGYDTIVGAEGRGLSQGQKQRLLIARAVYRNPAVILFDEATNSLDAGNERMIVENLDGFLKGRTAVVVAHRLSTVRNADNIIVLKEGRVCETGTHEALVALRGEYYHLVRNQLELGS